MAYLCAKHLLRGYDAHPGEKITLRSERRRRFTLAGSGLLTAVILAAVLGTMGLVWAAHLRGSLHKLSMVEIPPDTAVLPRPGGQELIQLQRMTSAASLAPQFSELTAMPGLGMGLLQLNMALPGQDPQGILLATPMNKLAGTLETATGEPTQDLRFVPLSLKVFPVEGQGEGQELLGTRAADQSRSDILPGGAGATANFASAPPAPSSGPATHPSGIDTTVSYSISDRGFDLAVTAKNVSQQAKAIVLSWSPRFAAPSGGLGTMRIVTPETATTMSRETIRPSEITLGTRDLHQTWTGLKYSYLSMGPEFRLRNVADGYSLNMLTITPSIRSIRADAEAGGDGVTISFSTENAPGSRTVIEPGESFQWHLRIQVETTDGYAPPAN